jgi:hypothetical protein
MWKLGLRPRKTKWDFRCSAADSKTISRGTGLLVCDIKLCLYMPFVTNININNFNSSWICSVLFIYISCEKRQEELETCVHCFRIGLTVLHHGGIYHGSCGRVPSLPQVCFTLLHKYKLLYLSIQS